MRLLSCLCHSERVREANTHRKFIDFNEEMLNNKSNPAKNLSFHDRETLRWRLETVKVVYLTRSG